MATVTDGSQVSRREGRQSKWWEGEGRRDEEKRGREAAKMGGGEKGSFKLRQNASL
jgi:hypothetical protein